MIGDAMIGDAMSCPRTDELLRTPREERDATDALEAHAASCPACSAAAASLEAVRRRLDVEPRPLSSSDRARLWQTIEARVEPWWAAPFSRPLRAAFAVVALSAIALTGLVLVRLVAPRAGLTVVRGSLSVEDVRTIGDGDGVPSGAVVATTDTELASDGLSVVARAGAALSFVSASEPVPTIVLRSGAAEVSFERTDGAPLSVSTPAGVIELVAAKVSIDVTPRATSIDVRDGRVRLVPVAGPSIELARGASHHIERPGSGGVQGAPVDDVKRDDVAALVQAADALRRAGRLVEAADAYAVIAERADAAGYAEEAALRRAQILHQLGRADDALVVLERAEQRFAGGGLAPERAGLAAAIFVGRGRLAEAAARVEAIDDELATEALSATRVEVASALVALDAPRARRLAERVADAQTTRELRVAALKVAAEAARRMDDRAGADALVRRREALE
ncbi:FecR family protein [Myxococcota bacterium]|nr:FecR family protein [Myxococcota bacterium]